MYPAVIALFIPIVAIVSTFTMIVFAIRYGTQQKDREAFYRAENLRRITESSGEGAKAALDLLRGEERQRRIKSREGMKIGGLVNLAVGIALIIFLRMLVHDEPVYLCGLIPGFIGAALLIYVYLLAAPVE